MFRLLKLAAVALFGYALYEFIRGITNDPKMRSMAQQALGGGQDGGQGGGRSFGTNESAGQNITGPGEGEEVATLERDGGSVRHKVGRGVIS
jgi:hypothetical protein